MAEMTEPVIRCLEAVYAYPDGTKALSGITFSVANGECVGITGANGSGKSTLLALLGGVFPPSLGLVTLRGVSSTQRSLKEFRRSTGLVFQNADEQLFCPTVLEDALFGPLNLGLSPEKAQQAARDALDATGIAHLGQKAPYALSGGEKRCAAIAAVLAMTPELLLLDEPTAALDPRSRRRIARLLASLPQTKLIASHDMDLLWDLCDRVLVLNQGTITADGPAKMLLADAALLEAAGLELPFVLQSSPSRME